MKIWLDDLRNPPASDWWIARGYTQFRTICEMAVTAHKPLEMVSFDHDLGAERDGYDCIKLLASPEFCEIYPSEVQVHSANPVGRENILAYDAWYRRMRDDESE